MTAAEIRNLVAVNQRIAAELELATQRSARLEAELRQAWERLEERIDRNHVQILANKTLYTRIEEHLWPWKESMEHLRWIKLGGFSIFNRRSAACLLGLSVIGYFAKEYLYERIGAEAAELAGHALEQERLVATAVGTVNAIAKDPETLTALVGLLKGLLQDPATRAALADILSWTFQQPNVLNDLIGLLQWAFRDASLQATTGEFAMKALDEPQVKQMLEAQTAALVRATVNDARVQQDTGAGLQAACLYATTPRFFSRTWWKRGNTSSE